MVGQSNPDPAAVGDVLHRGDAGYEVARQSAVWHLRKPDRYPDVIVRVRNDQDVVNAVRRAREQGLKVNARGGGHSMSGSAVRDGMMIDFSEFREYTIDPQARTATVTPSVTGDDFGAAVREHGLFFPSGHCAGVGLGGYLLQGGFGWNGQAMGMACSSVRAIDVVTADGELIHCDDTTNPDYMWAARGAGSGFFGVVTRFYLDLYPKPASILASFYTYPIDALPDVLPWFLEALPLPRSVDPFLLCVQPPGSQERVLPLLAVSFTDSEQEGRDALAVLETCPAIDRALERRFAAPASFDELYGFMSNAATPGRYCVDGMWTHASPATLLPELQELFTSFPTPKSHLIFYPWRETEVPNGAFSLQAPLYLSPVAVWDDGQDDERCIEWATGQMRRLEPLSAGIQLADENLINRPAPFMAPENRQRLEQLREKHDPGGLFHSYLLS
ncbi:FAD-binding oxidoreductase [Streptomyces griseorubiginosus]|uniref:FAD-binding oxidoreductase n=1 Tax=Streptomyces griseorubiginosus TaxID=67304 RepID=UPI001AD789DE|nr:FAD-binding oxidoreductase [Streptomyces griseorubiginosus]MBO4253324.1 FAD-binding protein [Streptomyces griseorubiginosus]